MKRTIKVLDLPVTYIEIDSELSDQEIKANWLQRYGKCNNTLSQASKSLESGMIRKAKGMFKTYK